MLKNKTILILTVLALVIFTASCKKTVVAVSGTLAFTEWDGGSTLEFQGDSTFTVHFDFGTPCDPKVDHLDSQQSNDPKKGRWVASCQVAASQPDYSPNFIYTITGQGASRVIVGVAPASGGGTIPCKSCPKNPTPTAALKFTASVTSIEIRCSNDKQVSLNPVDAPTSPATTPPGSLVQWTLIGDAPPDSTQMIKFGTASACPFGSNPSLSCAAGPAIDKAPYTVTWKGCTGSDTSLPGTLTISSPGPSPIVK